ncbi:MAG: hypothetical protein JNK15_08365 [Planctomycetes bacterium]|nr:hypothetical protein [Planctomycetota bacterium]
MRIVFQPLNGPTLAPQGQGLRISGQPVSGGTITVNVGSNDSVIEIKDTSTSQSTRVDVAPGKDTNITLPNVPGGTVVVISVGRGTNRRAIYVEVASPSP